MIRLVIIEDEELIRLGISTAINREFNMEMVGAASTGLEGIQLVEQLSPDIVLVDIGLPDITGLDVIDQIKHHANIKIIVLSSHSSQDIVQAALEKGANSYILKKNNAGLIIEAIKSTYDNKNFFDPDIAKRSFQSFFQHQKIKGKCYQDRLTRTEIKIIRLMSSGLSNKKIGEQMFITESTVKGHSTNIFSKLGVGDRVNAIIKAKELGYIEDSLKVS